MTKDLFYKIEGSGTPVLLIHGFTGSHKSFQKVSSFLSSQFKVITVDMIGHGQSMNYESKNYTFDKSINDLNKILDSLSIKKNKSYRIFTWRKISYAICIKKYC